jgi:hypothetical protein
VLSAVVGVQLCKILLRLLVRCYAEIVFEPREADILRAISPAMCAVGGGKIMKDCFGSTCGGV